MKIAVLGGTFDPIHIGHLLMGEQAYNSFDLDRVIYMPAGIPPHKVDKEISKSKHRLKMVKLAVKDNSHFNYSDWELKRDGRSYTVDTLNYMYSKYPDDDIYFIIGSDSLRDIFQWKDTEYLLENAKFIVAQRPGFTLENIYKDERLRPYRDYINIMENMMVDISSTRIRQNVKEGYSIKYMTLPVIIDYIKRNNLYRGE